MILRGKTTQKMRAIVRFALANPDAIAAMLEEKKKLKIAKWLSKESLTAILEVDIEDVKGLAEADYVAYIDIGGRLGASSGVVNVKAKRLNLSKEEAMAKESTSSEKTNVVEK